MSARALGSFAITAALLASPAMAQMARDFGGAILKPNEVKAALFGTDMSGFSPTYNMAWSECIDPKGDTIYQTPDGKIKGRLVISPDGKACYSYEDDNFETVACYTVKKSDHGLRFEDDFKAGSVFIATKVVTGIKSCTQDLIG